MSFTFGETLIDTGTDAVTGQPVLYVQATPRGAHLVQALLGSLPPACAGFYAVPHDAGLDVPLCELIDILIGVRYAQPHLCQLRLFTEVPL